MELQLSWGLSHFALSRLLLSRPAVCLSIRSLVRPFVAEWIPSSPQEGKGKGRQRTTNKEEDKHPNQINPHNQRRKPRRGDRVRHDHKAGVRGGGGRERGTRRVSPRGRGSPRMRSHTGEWASYGLAHMELEIGRRRGGMWPQ